MDKIIVTDNFLTKEEIEKTLDIIKNNNWYYGHISNSLKELIIEKQPFWYMKLTKNEYFSVYLKDIIEKHMSKKFILKRVYATGVTFGQESTFHYDDLNPNTYTACLYLTKIEDEYIETAGGYIYFKIPNEKYDICYEPVFNRLICFPSHYIHKGSPFTRYIMDLRICAAWKLEEV